MKALALLLLAALALASVPTGATPDTAPVAVEMAEVGPADVSGDVEVVEALMAAPASAETHVPARFVDAARVPASWASASDVPPPEA